MSVATDETSSLIASDKVEGTAVYNRQGERLGTISKVMIDKMSGHVAYAVLSFGGILGLGDKAYPLPWEVLTYDTGEGGYVVDMDKDRLSGAPNYDPSNEPDYDDAYRMNIRNYYGAGTYA